MERVEKIESYGKYDKFFEKIEEIEAVRNPYLIVHNDKEYVVSNFLCSCFIAKEIEDKISLYTTIYDNSQNLIGYSKDFVLYELNFESKFPCISKTDAIANKVDILQYGKLYDGEYYVHHIQKYLKSSKFIKLQYAAYNFNDENIKLYINYLSNHDPFALNVGGLLFSKTYMLDEIYNTNKYYKTITFGKRGIILFRNGYTLEQLLGDDFSKELPKDIISILNGNDLELKEINEVGNIYKKTLKK